MKKVKMMLAAAMVAVALTSCSSVGILGGVYHKVVQPVAVTSNIVGTKVGTSKCTSILGIAAYGDGGIDTDNTADQDTEQSALQGHGPGTEAAVDRQCA
jgi:hypothetical protein